MFSYLNNIQGSCHLFPLHAQTLSSKNSKPRLNLLLRILQRPFTPRFPTPHLIHLRLREPFRLNGGIVPDPCLALHISVLHGLIRPSIRPLVNRHHGGASEAEIVLQRDLCVPDEPVVGPAAQLPDELGALRDPGRSERVALGYEAAGGIDHAAASVRYVSRSHHLVCFSWIAEAEGVERDHLVGGKAVV